VSTAFMELFTIQATAARVEAGDIPKALKRCAGFVTARGFVAVDRFHDEAHTRALREGKALIGLENAVVESCCHDLNYLHYFLWAYAP